VVFSSVILVRLLMDDRSENLKSLTVKNDYTEIPAEKSLLCHDRLRSIAAGPEATI